MVHMGILLIMGLLAVLSAAVPLGVMLLLRRRGGPWPAFWVGAGTFFLFALVLEPLLHRLVLSGPLGTVIQGNIWLYGLYGGLAAGVFEETGRYLAFRLALRRRRARITALSYGIGHGGCEAFLLLGVTMLNNIAVVLMQKNGASLPPELEGAVQTLAAVPAASFLWGGFERLSAMVFHMAASVLVFTAAARPGKRRLFPLAVVLHLVLDMAAVVSNAYLPIAATELLTAALALACAWLAARVYKNLSPEAEIT